MQLKRLSAALAAAGFAFSGQALALGPDVTAQIQIWFSGASAPDNSLQNVFTSLCLANTLDVYKNDNVSSPGNNYRAFSCNLNSALIPGLSTQNPTVEFIKRSAGGSAQGVQPVAREQAISFLVVSSANCTETSPGSRDWRCSDDQPGETENKVPDGGFSDVEPLLFRGPNTPSGFTDVTTADNARLVVNATSATDFGIPVTRNLRDALQDAQGLTVGSDNAANMPTLSRGQIASIMTGRVPNWTRFLVGGLPLTNFGTPPSSNTVHICRRTPGSGTQATVNAQIMGSPCTAGALVATRAPGLPGGVVVVENSGSGDVNNCMQGKDDSNLWAIGLQSTEQNPTLAFDYRYIRVDGVLPTIDNVANGTYSLWGASTMQWRTSPEHFNDTNSAADILLTLQKFATDVANPTELAASNASFVHPWGPGGLLALPDNGFVVDNDADGLFDAAWPVTAYTRKPSGVVNNCIGPYIFGGASSPFRAEDDNATDGDL